VDLGYDTAHLSDPTVAVIGGTGVELASTGLDCPAATR